MSSTYLSWWIGGPLLAAVALGYPVLTRAALGVSGAVAKVLSRTPKPSAKVPEDWGSAVGATAGPGTIVAAPDCNAPVVPDCSAPVVPVKAGTVTGTAIVASADRGAQVIFLLGIVGGGAIAALWAGNAWGRSDYAPRFHHFFGSGWSSGLVLLLGGILVGFGTRWSGGCTSGHGLSGVGRLQPASLVATAVFFGVAIGVSFLLEALWP